MAQSRKRAKSSWYWKHIDTISKEDVNLYKCRYCNTTWNTTSNNGGSINSHILKRHPTKAPKAETSKLDQYLVKGDNSREKSTNLRPSNSFTALICNVLLIISESMVCINSPRLWYVFNDLAASLNFGQNNKIVQINYKMITDMFLKYRIRYRAAIKRIINKYVYTLIIDGWEKAQGEDCIGARIFYRDSNNETRCLYAGLYEIQGKKAEDILALLEGKD